MDAPVLTTETHDKVATLTLNRPGALNALSDGLLAVLKETFADLAETPEVKAVVIRGAGKAFCAGHDLKEMQAGRQSPDEGQAYFDDLSRAVPR